MGGVSTNRRSVPWYRRRISFYFTSKHSFQPTKLVGLAQNCAASSRTYEFAKAALQLDTLLQFVYNVFTMLLNASLDTSFWNVAGQIGVTPYLFGFFRLYYCGAVRREIITTDPNQTMLVYPQARLFQVFEEDGRLHGQEPQHPLRRFGAGEAHAMALALENKWILLINDYRPLLFAQSLGIACISVPDFCTMLYAKGNLTYPAIQGYLKRVAATTNPSLITQAEAIVTQIAVQRGEDK